MDFSPSPLYGFSPLPTNRSSYKFKDPTYHPTPHVLNDSIEIKTLIKILNLCKERNINLVGVISPIYSYPSGPGITDSIFQLYKYPLIDNSGFRLPFDPEEYFKDPYHMNQLGAKEYTKYFMKQLLDSLHYLSDYKYNLYD